nr:hypothetical protein [Tanacetum cinerariifolium]
MDTLSLVSEYLKSLEECMDDGDSRVAKEMKLFDALEHKSVVIEVGNQKFSIFTKAPLRAFGEPFMRYYLPCKVDGQGAWEAELDLADSANYVTKKVLDSMGFVHVSISDYGGKMVNDVNVEIHRVKFKADFVVLDYANEGEPSIMFGKDFLATTKIQFNFRLGEIRMNLIMFEEVNGVIDLLEEVGSSKEIPPTSTIPPQPIYYPLTSKQREKIKEVLDIKYKELEESKHILEVMENYLIYKKKLDEILMGKERLNKKDFSKEDKVGIIEHCLPKQMCNPRNYVLPMMINGVVEMVALVDTRASVIRHTSFPKPRSKSYVETFEMGGEDDWLGNFEVGRDQDGNAKYGLVAPSFLDIEDDMERALAMEAYFNPFKNIIVFKKLVD